MGDYNNNLTTWCVCGCVSVSVCRASNHVHVSMVPESLANSFTVHLCFLIRGFCSNSTTSQVCAPVN